MRHFTAAATLMLGLAGCAQSPLRQAAPAAAVQQPLARMTVVTPDADHDLLAQLMAGEMALGRTDLKAASLHYGKAMVLTGVWPQPGHPTQMTRMTYAPLADGSVEQSGVTSDDNGKTWQPSFDLIYVRAKK